jgi:hypothetical protein
MPAQHSCAALLVREGKNWAIKQYKLFGVS